MPEPPLRKRFQIHLSTAIVMMFVAGGLIWANTRISGQKSDFMEFLRVSEISSERLDTMYGWPFDAIVLTSRETMERGDYMSNVTETWRAVWGIVANLLVASAILLAVWFLCEWLIRRRAARKDA